MSAQNLAARLPRSYAAIQPASYIFSHPRAGNQFLSFWEEVRRRKVVRTTIAYLAGAFVAAQVMDLLVGALDLPRRVLSVTVVLLIARSEERRVGKECR